MTKVGREAMSTGAPVTNRLDAGRIEALIDARFPQIHSGGRTLVIEEVGERSARVRLKHHERHIRPGGTVSGPTMFTLADVAVYVTIIAALGEVGLDAVTTNLNVNLFLLSKINGL
jgi:acyl-coenzyme A thioesterase PaaI-like protein